MTDVARDPKAVGSGRYPAVAILLHWLIAALIVTQIVLAGRMEGPRSPETFAVVQLHKSVGVTILLLSLIRLAWRLMHPPPPLPATMARWERALARWTHVGFYVVMIGAPLTGWVMVSTSRTPTPMLLYGLVPWPLAPGLPELAASAREVWHEAAEAGHDLVVKLFYLLIALHVAGALKHQLFSRDQPVLSRMAPGAVAGRWREPRILLILAGLALVAALARWAPPPDPGVRPPAAAVTPLGPAQEPLEAQGPREPATADTAPSPR